MFYVYTLISLKDKDLYWGYSSNLKERMNEHEKGYVRSTRDRRPLKLVYYEAYAAESDARNREKQLKRRAKAFGGIKKRIKDSIEKNK